MKKFYKLVHSLEERAREHGNDRLKALGSVEGLLEHLGYTRNARDFTSREEPKLFATENNLKKKAAMKLDQLIETGLDEQKTGKTRVIRSLADLDPRK